MNSKSVILIVDDNDMQLSLMTLHLKSLNNNYELETASSGDIALELLNANPERYDIVLLDRSMPGTDGIEVLKKIRAHPILKDVPVILQTALSNKEEIIEGLAAGAYYYLTKPIEKELMLIVVNAAMADRDRYNLLRFAIQKQNKCISNLQSATFEFNTVDQANDIAILLANIYDNPNDIVNGLAELLINAIEHGNLGISYEEKTILKESSKWQAELDTRLQMPEYENRLAKIEVSRSLESIVFTITDEGNGFDWNAYMDFAPERMMDSHGRGIAVANKLCFSKVEYQGVGNIVQATVSL